MNPIENEFYTHLESVYSQPTYQQHYQLNKRKGMIEQQYEKTRNERKSIQQIIEEVKEIMNIEAYAKAAAEAGIKLVVTGYTDTIGSDAYNKGLAEKRAQAVADVLKKAGVETEIKIVPFGETNECKEKYLNRRAVIEIAK